MSTSYRDGRIERIVLYGVNPSLQFCDPLTYLDYYSKDGKNFQSNLDSRQGDLFSTTINKIY